MSIAAAITEHAKSVIAVEGAARARLADRLAGTAEITSFDYAAVMEAAANAAPWKNLLAIAERKGSVRDAVEKVRMQAFRVLVEYRESVSTSAITNEIDRVKREGLRSFLSYTEYALELLHEDGAAAKEEEPQTPQKRISPLAAE
ncbi:hypothetical protein [Streptomyces halobius]|uniref:Uncharacterized protein n=1 Tax=Streptomyces halobius TaxID=2879846 RepID=A0ABY4MGX1_9ACTN|nr:hypothetical protein [Streptomyces halobius]UQA95650.1 hypothetical protein K9S39_30680 [Streptomyces halobius]